MKELSDYAEDEICMVLPIIKSDEHRKIKDLFTEVPTVLWKMAQTVQMCISRHAVLIRYITRVR